MGLGHKIKHFRELNRISQQEIADLINVSQKTYSNYESCKTAPSTIHLIKLSKILNFDFLKYLKEKEGYINLEDDKESKSFSEKIKDNLLVNYEIILRDKEEIISLLKEKIERLKKSL
jgi:transcriptional regulator with XRE-family HTH domain